MANAVQCIIVFYPHVLLEASFLSFRQFPPFRAGVKKLAVTLVVNSSAFRVGVKKLMFYLLLPLNPTTTRGTGLKGTCFISFLSTTIT